jgi:hypothetical protein
MTDAFIPQDLRRQPCQATLGPRATDEPPGVSPGGIVERNCGPERPDPDLRTPFFVMAHHRSGSNFLNDLLQVHPHLECINEPLSMHTPYFRECDLVRWSAGAFDPELLHASLGAHPGLRTYLLDLREYMLSSHRGRVVGFKDTVLFGKLEWLSMFMPTLKILFLKRSPRSIVSSILRSDLATFWNYAELVPRAFEGLFPDVAHRPLPDHDEAKAAEVAAMSVVVRYELAARTLGRFDHRVVELERLVGEPEVALPGITDFLGVERHEAPLRFIRARGIASRGGTFSSFRSAGESGEKWKHHLSARQVRVIEDVLEATSGRDSSRAWVDSRPPQLNE